MCRSFRASAGWVLLVVALAAAAVAHGQDRPRSAREVKTYTNASWRWTISYPAGWTIDAKDPDVIRIRPAAGDGMCSILSGPVDRFNTVDELTNFMVAHDERFLKEKGQKLVVLARRPITLPNNIIGNDVLADIGPGGRSRRVHAIADGRGFAIDCEAYTKNWSKLEAVYQRIIGSFTVRK